MPKAIVTGATGYIGSHLVKELIKQNWEVDIIADPKFGYKNIEDIKDKISIFEYSGNINQLIDFFNANNADVVFHLAAAVITNPTPAQIPTIIDSNIRFGTEVLEAMSLSSTRLIISTGTYWQNYNNEDYNPVDLYAASKEAFEKILKYYTEAKNIRAITLRLYDVYGEDDNRPKIWNLLKNIAGTNQSIDMSPGGQMIDLVHIDDIVQAYIKTFEYLVNDESINNKIFGVYKGQSKTLKNLVEEYENFIGKPMKINWGGKNYKNREMMNLPKKFPAVPGWDPKFKIFKKH